MALLTLLIRPVVTQVLLQAAHILSLLKTLTGCNSTDATVTIGMATGTPTTPTFALIGPLCQNSVAPTLPTTSSNGITGTWNPATINTTTLGFTTYTFTPDAGQCATGATMNITISNQITPTFTAIGPLCQNSTPPALPLSSLNGITGTWNPAAINTSALGTAQYIFTPDAGQCGATVRMNITITNQITPTFNAIGPLCQNSTAPALPLTSLNGITGTWNPATINTTTIGQQHFIFTPDAGQCGTTTSLDVNITNQITPTFATIGPLCQNSTAPPLPTTSANGITGTWNPAVISTTTVGQQHYTFTPDAGQCGTSAGMDITITTQITPAFDAIGPLCQNSTAPILPLTSNNGITGTWNPAVINTTAIGSIPYTFTPDAGQCGVPVTIPIDIVNQITPTFDPIGPLCLNSVPPALPTVSNNGITGSWSPSISTGTVGATDYTFTPDAGQCGTTAVLRITVSNQITPTFAAIGPLCQNSIAPSLPATSLEGISGTWNPATINTSGLGQTTYMFTPAGGQCGVQVLMQINIVTQVTPTFAAIGPLCQNSVAPVLPATSIEGISGTWSPATINTTTTGTTTYRFTPSIGQCGISVTIDVTVNGPSGIVVTPTNAACGTSNGSISLGTVTGGVAPYLYSVNGSAFTTTTVYNNLAAGNYTVKVQDANGCIFNAQDATIINTGGASAVATTIVDATCGNSNGTITIVSVTGGTGAFTYSINGSAFTNNTVYSNLAAGDYIISVIDANGCRFDAPPVKVLNGGGATAIAVTPVDATCGLNNGSITLGLVTGGVGPYTYDFNNSGTFTAITIYNNLAAGSYDIAVKDANGCIYNAPTTRISNINNLILPTFTQIGPLCQNSVAPLLPATSIEGITGTWAPATINTAALGTTTYTFTPGAGQCGTTATMNITIATQITPTFAQIGPLCQNSVAPLLPATSIEGITGTWAPATINTATLGTTTYTFTPGAGQCGTTATMNITIATQITPTFAQIGPLCQNSAAPYYRQLPLKASPVHGRLRQSIRQRSEQRLIHLLLVQVSAVRLQP